MNYAAWRSAGIIFPAMIVGAFESVRHYYLEQLLPGMVGNIVAVTLVLVVTFFFYQMLFNAIDKINQQLIAEQNRSALLRERNRMAREMHDGLNQSLFYLNITLRAADRHVENGALTQARKHIAEARSVMSDLYEEVRQTIHDLRKGVEGEWSLTEAIKQTLRNLSDQGSTRTSLSVSPESSPFYTQPEALHVLRIAQEAIYNARRHSDASEVSVCVTLGDSEGRLEVQDNGKGFDPNDIEAANHYGLQVMRERAGLIDADLEVISESGRGTHVVLTFPVASEGRGQSRHRRESAF